VLRLEPQIPGYLPAVSIGPADMRRAASEPLREAACRAHRVVCGASRLGGAHREPDRLAIDFADWLERSNRRGGAGAWVGGRTMEEGVRCDEGGHAGMRGWMKQGVGACTHYAGPAPKPTTEGSSGSEGAPAPLGCGARGPRIGDVSPASEGPPIRRVLTRYELRVTAPTGRIIDVVA